MQIDWIKVYSFEKPDGWVEGTNDGEDVPEDVPEDIPEDDTEDNTSISDLETKIEDL